MGKSKAKARAARKRAASQRGNRMRGNVSVPSTPWDHGATGAANRVNLVVEDRADIDPETGKKINPNGVTGARRKDMLEVYADRGWISQRAYGAGEMLRVSWLRTDIGRCAPWLRERVDSSQKPDAAVAIQIDRIAALLRVSSLIPAEDRTILDCVCGRGDPIGRVYRGSRHEAGKAHLVAALERLADRIEGLA